MLIFKCSSKYLKFLPRGYLPLAGQNIYPKKPVFLMWPHLFFVIGFISGKEYSVRKAEYSLRSPPRHLKFGYFSLLHYNEKYLEHVNFMKLIKNINVSVYHQLFIPSSHLSRFCFQFQKYHHAPGTFNCNVIKESSQASSALETP